jgi:methylmalonyl-CoA/ethylmalonyl-CoA epimerase
VKLIHVGAAVHDIEQARVTYEKVFGYVLLAGPVVDPIQNVAVCFVGTGSPGDLSFELVCPLAGESPVSSMLRKNLGAYHVCYQVEDIERTLREVRSKGCIVWGEPVPAVAFDGRRIAWFYTPAHLLVEVAER